jgi:hypothetical protein
MIKKFLLIMFLCSILLQGIALAGFKVWVSPDFDHKTPFDVKRGETIKGLITIKNQNDFTVKGQAESTVAWASITPKDFSLSPNGEIKLDYMISTPNQGSTEGAFKIIQWAEESAQGIGMTGKYSTVIPFTLQVDGEVIGQTTIEPTSTEPIKSEPKYFLSINFILAIIALIVACITAAIFLLSQKKAE